MFTELIGVPIKLALGLLIQDHPSPLLTILLLVGLLVCGWLEAVVFRRRDWACATWFIGLAGLAFWIASPLTPGRIWLGVITFICGLSVMVIFYRKEVSQRANKT